MEWPDSHWSSGGKYRLCSTAFRNPKSIGFSVPRIAGASDVIHSQRKKKARNTASAATNVRHSDLMNDHISLAVPLKTSALTTAAAAAIAIIVPWVLGISRVNPAIHNT